MRGAGVTNDVERALLGAALLDAEAAKTVTGLLAPEDFAEERHGVIFDAIAALVEADQVPDILTASEELRRRRRITRAGGAAYVSSLVDVVPDVANVAYYCELIAGESRKRRAVEAMRRVAAEPGVNPEAVAVAQEALAQLLPQSTQQGRAVPLEELLAMEFPPIRWIFDDVLKAGDVVLVHGAAGVGKTHICMAISLAAAAGIDILGWSVPEPVSVLYVDGELGARASKDRLAQLRRGLEIPDINGRFRLAAYDLQSGIVPPLNGDGFEPWLMSMLRPEPSLVVLDNVTTLTAGFDENDAMAWDRIIRLGLATRKRNIALLLVHHSNRAGGYRGSSRQVGNTDLVMSLARPHGAGPGLHALLAFEKARGIRPEAARSLEIEMVESDAKGLTISWRTGTDAIARRARELLMDEGLSVRAAHTALVEEYGSYLAPSKSSLDRWRKTWK